MLELRNSLLSCEENKKRRIMINIILNIVLPHMNKIISSYYSFKSIKSIRSQHLPKPSQPTTSVNGFRRLVR